MRNLTSRIGIQKKGEFYSVTGGHLPQTFAHSKKAAQNLAAARLHLLEKRTARFDRFDR